MADPTARTLSLLSLLQTHRTWHGAELAAELGVSERTVRRDIDRLRSLGYPVDGEPGVEGGYRLAVGAHMPPLLLTDDEAIALAIGVRATALTAIEGIDHTAVALMAKVEQMLPDRLRRRIDAFDKSVEVMRWPHDGATVRAEDLAVLGQGCRAGEEVRFTYTRRDGEESKRLVEPHQLVSSGRRWYLVAFDVRRGDWRTFRIDRMSGPTLAGKRFERRRLPTADAATFVQQGMRAMSAEHSATLLVTATPDELAPVARWFGATPEPTHTPDRSRLTLTADTQVELASMVAVIATRFDLDLDDATGVDLGGLLGQTSSRLSSIAGRT